MNRNLITHEQQTRWISNHPICKSLFSLPAPFIKNNNVVLCLAEWHSVITHTNNCTLLLNHNVVHVLFQPVEKQRSVLPR